MADLHDDADAKVFSSIILVSDRNVIDAQLREALFEFARTKRVVATITSETGSMRAALAGALDAGRKIMVCTMLTFRWRQDRRQGGEGRAGAFAAVRSDMGVFVGIYSFLSQISDYGSFRPAGIGTQRYLTAVFENYEAQS